MTLKLVLFFTTFRIANLFLIQSQFDPDEYWQNLEPSYCYIFGDDPIFDEYSSCPGLTWEWRRRQQSQLESAASSKLNEHWSHPFTNSFIFGLEGPVRSFASIFPTLVFYAVIKKYRWDSSWMVSRGPLVINSIFVAATTDWTVWYTSKWMKTTIKGHSNNIQNDEKKNSLVFWCVYCQLSSWFNAYTLIRTYSNSLETLLLSLSFALVSPVFLSTNETLNTSTISTMRSWFAFFLGGICVSIRFTCLTAYIPMGIILARQTKNTFNYLFRVCALAGLLGFLSTVILDRVMFGVWAIPVLGNFHFNVIQGNGSLYGTHPFYWYFIAGVPAITGILFPVLIYDLLFGTWNRATRNLWTIIACYVIAHSWSGHKEFRFLLPILPMICLLCGMRIQNLVTRVGPSRRKQIMIACAVPNLVAILYLGLVHQRAPIEVNRAILKAVAAAGNLQPDIIQVHYLMGCHSTPLLSHLHDPPTKFVPWYLDCSPECRKNPEIECESDAFSKDPDKFIKNTYYDCHDGNENEDQTCPDSENSSEQLRSIPDYIVCNASDLRPMKVKLASMDMLEIGRFVNGINGFRLWGNIEPGDDVFSSFGLINVGKFGELFSLSYAEMVLLQRK